MSTVILFFIAALMDVVPWVASNAGWIVLTILGWFFLKDFQALRQKTENISYQIKALQDQLAGIDQHLKN